MAMSAQEIVTLIQVAFPEAQVEIQDLRGDGDHYAVRVTADQFKGKTRIQQHQMVYAALNGKMGGQLHALSVTTCVP